MILRPARQPLIQSNHASSHIQPSPPDRVCQQIPPSSPSTACHRLVAYSTVATRQGLVANGRQVLLRLPRTDSSSTSTPLAAHSTVAIRQGLPAMPRDVPFDRPASTHLVQLRLVVFNRRQPTGFPANARQVPLRLPASTHPFQPRSSHIQAARSSLRPPGVGSSRPTARRTFIRLYTTKVTHPTTRPARLASAVKHGFDSQTSLRRMPRQLHAHFR